MRKEWLDNPKLKCCYTWNKPFFHDKLFGLPIGLNKDRHDASIEKALSTYDLTEKSDKLLCVQFSTSTDKQRSTIRDKAQNEWNSFCDTIPYVNPIKSFSKHSYADGRIDVPVSDPQCYKIMSKYAFVLSPRGAGEDTHRTWEALYVGCIPIVLSSSLDELYQDLPVVVVNNWDEITKDFLEEKIIEHKSRKEKNQYCMEKLCFDYWVNRMETI